jgi:hypothetical protein
MSFRKVVIRLLCTVGLVCPAMHATTLRGYVVDSDGRRVQGAHVQAWHMVATDQRPPQRPKRLAQTTTDRHGNFALSADPRAVNMIIASFDNQSGTALPSFSSIVRVSVRHNRPRPVVGSSAPTK